MTFEQPIWLILLLIVGGIYYLKKKFCLGEPSRLLWFGTHILPTQGGTWRLRLATSTNPLFWSAIALLCIAMARPQRLWEEQLVETDGVDIMMAMDISPSMLTKDFNPDRLTVAKKIAISFVDNRPYDRLGLVAFSAEAFTQCPLTTDRKVLQQLINQLEIGKLEDGTAIGMGLATAVNRLKDSPSKSKVVILLTDGENNAGYLQPLDAAELAKTFGVRVYTIGVGNTGVALSPAARNPFTGEYEFAMRQTTLDTELLEKIAEMTKGKFYRALNEYQLDQIYDEIGRLETSKIEVTYVQRKTDYFSWFIGVAVCLLLLVFSIKFIFVKSITV